MARKGVGEDIAAWVSYAAARRTSKERARFGKGSTEGLMAAEAGNNACAPGAIIPLLTLAIPGSAPAAVLLAALFIHGIRPGPMIMIETPGFVWEVVAMLALSTLCMVLLGIAFVRPLLLILRVSRERLAQNPDLLDFESAEIETMDPAMISRVRNMVASGQIEFLYYLHNDPGFVNNINVYVSDPRRSNLDQIEGLAVLNRAPRKGRGARGSGGLVGFLDLELARDRIGK